MEVDDSQQGSREHRARKAFHIISQPRQGECLGIVALFRQNIGNGRLKSGRERCRSRLKHEDQDVDLPDLADERQADRDGGAQHIHRDEKGATRQPVGKGAYDGSHTNIGDHLDGQRGPQHCACRSASNVIGEQPQRDHSQPGSDQSHHLRQEQVTVCPIAQHRKHCMTS